MATDNEDLRVLLAEFRGELSTSLAQISGDMRLFQEQNNTLATKFDQLATKVDELKDGQPQFVTKKEVDRKINTGAAVIGVFIAGLTVFLQFFLARTAS